MTDPSRTPQWAAALGHDAPPGEVSVIMVSYRTGPVLALAVDAVLAPDQEGVTELILVDNGNSPGVTAALARRMATEPHLRLISGHGNVGYARGCNLGAREARGRYLLLLNPDCCLGPGAIPALLAEAAALGDEWMLGCRVRNADGTDQRGSRRALLTPVTALVEAFRLDRLSPTPFQRHRLSQHETALPEGTARVPAISGACMMLPAATYRAAGGMDEGYFLHVEDLDLCLRLYRAGIPTHFAPHVEAVHHASTSRTHPLAIEWHKTRGFLRYFGLHYGRLRWLPVLVPLAVATLSRLGLRIMLTLFRPAGWRTESRPPRLFRQAPRIGA